MNALEKYAAKQQLALRLASEFEKNANIMNIIRGALTGAKSWAAGARRGFSPGAVIRPKQLLRAKTGVKPFSGPSPKVSFSPDMLKQIRLYNKGRKFTSPMGRARARVAQLFRLGKSNLPKGSARVGRKGWGAGGSPRHYGSIHLDPKKNTFPHGR